MQKVRQNPTILALYLIIFDIELIYYRAHRAKLEIEGDLTQLAVEIPVDFMGLIAALVQDSEEPFTVLSTRIDDLLSPFLRNESGNLFNYFINNTYSTFFYIVSHKFEYAIEKAIKQVAHRVNYGLAEEVYANIEHTPPKIPWVVILFYILQEGITDLYCLLAFMYC